MAGFTSTLRGLERDQQSQTRLEDLLGQLEEQDLTPAEISMRRRQKQELLGRENSAAGQAIIDLQQQQRREKLRGGKRFDPSALEVSKQRLDKKRQNPQGFSKVGALLPTDVTGRVLPDAKDRALSLDTQLREEAMSLAVDRAQELLRDRPDTFAKVNTTSKFSQGGTAQFGDAARKLKEQRGENVANAMQSLQNAFAPAAEGKITLGRGKVGGAGPDPGIQKEDAAFLTKELTGLSARAADTENPDLQAQGIVSSRAQTQTFLDSRLKQMRSQRRRISREQFSNIAVPFGSIDADSFLGF